MSDDIQYPDYLVERLHTIWGEGFLSPGGPEEVAEIVSALDLNGKTILDFGFGTGGPSIALARLCRTCKIIGIDVEHPMLDRATRLVERAGLSEQIDLTIVKPGRLPFEDTSFDIVFSKGVIIHIEDKHALFSEIIRVLKPGGGFVADDWLSGEAASEKAALDRFLEIVPLEFSMATAREMEATLSECGFENVTSRDRNLWFAENVDREIEAVEGPLRASMVEAFGEERVAEWIKVTRARGEAVHAGGLRPTHIRGFKQVR